VKNLSGEMKARAEEYRQMASLLMQELSSSELSDLDDAIRRLEELKIVVSAFGETNSGKSAYKNSEPENCPFSISANINRWDDEVEKNNRKTWKEVGEFEIIIQDTPGIAGDNPQHLQKAKRLAENSDVILYIVWQAIKGDSQVPVMRELLATKKPLIFVINKVDIQKPEEIEALKADLYRKVPGLNEEMLVLAAGDPIRDEPPLIEELLTKIVSVVEYKQNTLIHETLERTASKSTEIAAQRVKKRAEEEHRRQRELVQQKEEKIAGLKTQAETAINVYAIAASVAAGLVPLKLDFITSTLISSGMFIHIASIYDVEQGLGDVSAKAKELSVALFSILFVNAAALTAFLAISIAAKANPFTYVLGIAFDAAFTYFVVSAIGNTFSYYCANNLSWGSKENATEVLKGYVMKYIYELFINKLPQRFRDQVLRIINPDLLYIDPTEPVAQDDWEVSR
jgi:GTPase Era involved in 16S rRNA processing